ncbi:MAG: hypothetical protein LBJ62_01985 [Bifidobacteriaceae bacterium]|nr:hypothetical protein [Bifidobacteriaceae bacterium]
MPELQGANHGYPRPDFDRSARWVSLDGIWGFSFEAADAAETGQTSATVRHETIHVPGPWQTMASGGRHDWLEAARYQRAFTVPQEWADQRIILKFGAVFYAAEVLVNGQVVGSHEGGYSPFEFDISDALGASREGTLEVRVSAPNDRRDIPHGKQRSSPRDDYDGCCFTPCSGIWQSVWIEPRPETFIDSVRLTPRPQSGEIDVRVTVKGPLVGQAAVVCGLLGEDHRITCDAETPISPAGLFRATLAIDNPILWTPANPQLYDVTIICQSADGTDEVISYTGLRRIEARDRRLYLNGQELYLRGVLDQGYWPVTGLTPPDVTALETDITKARQAGFNLVRKHLKPEDPRWLYLADRAGMLVWAEPASLGRYSTQGTQRFQRDLADLIERDFNHPSIVIWGAYNEEWGLDWDLEADAARVAAARDAYGLIKQLDPTRLAVDNSGWSHVETDIVDWHYYNEEPDAFHFAARGLVTDLEAEFDVWHSPDYPVPKRLWAGSAAKARTGPPLINSEYGGGANSLDRAWHLRWQTQFLRSLPANRGYVYTELYDIEHETVGIYDADRRAKDMAGLDLRFVHCDTVIAPMIEPRIPGLDLIAPGGQTLPIPLRISHEGTDPVDGMLVWHLSGSQVGALPMKLAPHSLSPLEIIHLTLPAAYHSARIGIEFVVDDQVIARTFVDLAEAMPDSHLPQDSGWRPPRPATGWIRDNNAN